MPIESDALSYRALSLLEFRISTFRYPPGARLSADRLAEETGVGRTPVRAALEWLRRDGVIGHAARSGYFVKAPSVGDYQSLYRGSRALLIGSLLAPSSGDSAKKRAAATVEPNPDARKIRPIDPKSYATAADAIFNEIAGRSGSDVVVRAVEIINLRLRFARAVEAEMIKDAAGELARLTGLLPLASAPKLKRAVDAYHRRRLSMVGDLVDAACAKALRE